MLNKSLIAAALKALLNSYGSPERVRAMNIFVKQVPILDPIIMGTALLTDGIMPAPTMVTTIEVVAVAFCIIAVAIIPMASDPKGFCSKKLTALPALRANGDIRVKPITIIFRKEKRMYLNFSFVEYVSHVTSI
ncbi:hypothetical protein BpHYR1_003626 [Brachionus plicatilis]|uniref:Uncharacterized protein n=1 Tax=Brachionus plicatilis TaxID=10195 RepID=A0A3M7PD18_BRAPC|nr:hypothetical protein BpHYR1_003626 [Brachionus plicatilis]